MYLTSEDIKNRTNSAIELMKDMKLDFSRYDASAKNHEQRVPHVIYLKDEVKEQVNEVHDRSGRLEREIQFEHSGMTFVFFLFKDEHIGKFVMKAYTPAGDGVGGLKYLTERKFAA